MAIKEEEQKRKLWREVPISHAFQQQIWSTMFCENSMAWSEQTLLKNANSQQVFVN